jgi:tryptophan synthase alpha chain
VSRLATAFEGPARTRLITYVTAGDPDLARSREVVRALARGGAAAIEIGVPFSDPIADGPVIQRASERALAAGGTLESALTLVEDVRGDVAIPLVLFTYVNPVLRLGVDRFVTRAAAAGVDGVLLLDLPIEESSAMRGALDAKGIDQIFLVSPTTSDVRLREAARLGRGFLYAISRLGVTGATSTVSSAAAPLVSRIRSVASLPVALGFGISRPDHVQQVMTYADAAVVGSAIVRVIEEAEQSGDDVSVAVERFVAWLMTDDGRMAVRERPSQR